MVHFSRLLVIATVSHAAAASKLKDPEDIDWTQVKFDHNTADTVEDATWNCIVDFAKVEPRWACNYTNKVRDKYAEMCTIDRNVEMLRRLINDFCAKRNNGEYHVKRPYLKKSPFVSIATATTGSPTIESPATAHAQITVVSTVTKAIENYTIEDSTVNVDYDHNFNVENHFYNIDDKMVSSDTTFTFWAEGTPVVIEVDQGGDAVASAQAATIPTAPSHAATKSGSISSSSQTSHDASTSAASKDSLNRSSVVPSKVLVVQTSTQTFTSSAPAATVPSKSSGAGNSKAKSATRASTVISNSFIASKTTSQSSSFTVSTKASTKTSSNDNVGDSGTRPGPLIITVTETVFPFLVVPTEPLRTTLMTKANRPIVSEQTSKSTSGIATITKSGGNGDTDFSSASSTRATDTSLAEASNTTVSSSGKAYNEAAESMKTKAVSNKPPVSTTASSTAIGAESRSSSHQGSSTAASSLDETPSPSLTISPSSKLSTSPSAANSANSSTSSDEESLSHAELSAGASSSSKIWPSSGGVLPSPTTDTSLSSSSKSSKTTKPTDYSHESSSSSSSSYHPVFPIVIGRPTQKLASSCSFSTKAIPSSPRPQWTIIPGVPVPLPTQTTFKTVTTSASPSSKSGITSELYSSSSSGASTSPASPPSAIAIGTLPASVFPPHVLMETSLPNPSAPLTAIENSLPSPSPSPIVAGTSLHALSSSVTSEGSSLPSPSTSTTKLGSFPHFLVPSPNVQEDSTEPNYVTEQLPDVDDDLSHEAYFEDHIVQGGEHLSEGQAEEAFDWDMLQQPEDMHEQEEAPGIEQESQEQGAESFVSDEMPADPESHDGDLGKIDASYHDGDDPASGSSHSVWDHQGFESLPSGQDDLQEISPEDAWLIGACDGDDDNLSDPCCLTTIDATCISDCSDRGSDQVCPDNLDFEGCSNVWV